MTKQKSLKHFLAILLTLVLAFSLALSSVSFTAFADPNGNDGENRSGGGATHARSLGYVRMGQNTPTEALPGDTHNRLYDPDYFMWLPYPTTNVDWEDSFGFGREPSTDRVYAYSDVGTHNPNFGVEIDSGVWCFRIRMMDGSRGAFTSETGANLNRMRGDGQSWDGMTNAERLLEARENPDVIFDHGLVMQAYGIAVFNLLDSRVNPRGNESNVWRTFTANIGVVLTAFSHRYVGGVQFEVRIDGATVFDSGRVDWRYGNIPIEVPIHPGAEILELVVHRNSAHYSAEGGQQRGVLLGRRENGSLAAWADAKINFWDGAPPASDFVLTEEWNVTRHRPEYLDITEDTVTMTGFADPLFAHTRQFQNLVWMEAPYDSFSATVRVSGGLNHENSVIALGAYRQQHTLYRWRDHHHGFRSYEFDTGESLQHNENELALAMRRYSSYANSNAANGGVSNNTFQGRHLTGNHDGRSETITRIGGGPDGGRATGGGSAAANAAAHALRYADVNHNQDAWLRLDRIFNPNYHTRMMGWQVNRAIHHPDYNIFNMYFSYADEPGPNDWTRINNSPLVIPGLGNRHHMYYRTGGGEDGGYHHHRHINGRSRNNIRIGLFFIQGEGWRDDTNARTATFSDFSIAPLTYTPGEKIWDLGDPIMGYMRYIPGAPIYGYMVDDNGTWVPAEASDPGAVYMQTGEYEPGTWVPAEEGEDDSIEGVYYRETGEFLPGGYRQRPHIGSRDPEELGYYYVREPGTVERGIFSAVPFAFDRSELSALYEELHRVRSSYLPSSLLQMEEALAGLNVAQLSSMMALTPATVTMRDNFIEPSIWIYGWRYNSHGRPRYHYNTVNHYNQVSLRIPTTVVAFTQEDIDGAAAIIKAALGEGTRVPDIGLLPLITAAQLRVERNYTMATWNSLVGALAGAVTLVNRTNPIASGAELTTAYNALRAAYDGLVEITLAVRIAEIESLIASRQNYYTPNSWNELQLELTAANSLLGADDEALYAEMIERLNVAFDALLLRANLTTLNAEISAVEDNYNATDWTTHSWGLLQSAITTARTASLNLNATQASIDAQAGLVRAARNNLVARADITALEALIEYAKGLIPADFTPETWQDIPDLIEMAEMVAGNYADVSQIEVDDIYEMLNDAVEDLVVVAGRISKADLNALIARAGTYNESRFTEASWTAMQAALYEAQAVSENPNARRSQVAAAETGLQGALNSLVEVETGGCGGCGNGSVAVAGLFALVAFAGAFLFVKRRK